MAANTGSTIGAVGSGALAGSSLGPWGAAAGAGIGLLSSLLTPDSTANGAQIAANEQQNALNQQQYQHALTSLALQRSVAGSTDAQGSTVRYDPATNSWVSSFGTMPAAVQASQNQADITRNTVDLPQATANNAATSLQASLARRNLSGAQNALASYRDITPAAELGNLQQASTIANKQVQDPLIADTLRQFARSGTAAGPVLAQIGRGNSEALSKEMADNAVRSQTDAANVNSANRQNLASTANAFQAAGTPSLQEPQSAAANPAALLAASINGREASSTGAATAGAYSSPFGTSASNNASNSAIANGINTAFGAEKLGLIGKQISNAANNKDVAALFNGTPDTQSAGQQIAGSTLNPFGDAYTTGGRSDVLPPGLLAALKSNNNGLGYSTDTESP